MSLLTELHTFCLIAAIKMSLLRSWFASCWIVAIKMLLLAELVGVLFDRGYKDVAPSGAARVLYDRGYKDVAPTELVCSIAKRPNAPGERAVANPLGALEAQLRPVPGVPGDHGPAAGRSVSGACLRPREIR